MIVKVFVPSKEESRKIYGNIKFFKKSKMALLEDDGKQYSDISLNKLKLSPFVNIFKKGDAIALFHRYTMKKAYGGKELKEFLSDLKKKRVKHFFIGKKLLKNGFLVDSTFSKEKFLQSFRKRLTPIKPDIRIMYLILTDKCNFGCKYCFIEKGALRNEPVYGKMSYKIAKAGVDYFISQIKSKGEKKIIIYGGEPLINFDVLRKIVIYIRKKEKLGYFKGTVSFSLVTNGSLVTEEIAKFLAKEKISAGVSIDGPKKINDKLRISLENDKSAFEKAVKGFKILKKFSGNAGISCTIGIHNLNDLDKIIEYFVKKLDTKNISFNVPNLVRHQDDYEKLNVSMEDVVENIIKAYEKCREFGVAEDRVFNRRVNPFVEEFFWFADCAGYGNQIIVLPDGSVGPCHPFMGTKKFFEANVFKREDLTQHPVWIEWKRRLAVNMPECYDCAAISICGGGCAYQAYNDKGSIWERDERMCIFCNKILEWMIWDLYDKNSRF